MLFPNVLFLISNFLLKKNPSVGPYLEDNKEHKRYKDVRVSPHVLNLIISRLTPTLITAGDHFKFTFFCEG